MKALILAAGYATRLYPLTENQPKPLLKIGNKTIIDHFLSNLAGLGIDAVYIVTNAKFAAAFEQWAVEANSNVAYRDFTIEIINDGSLTNEVRLGAIGDIQFVIDYKCVDDELLISAGDNIYTFNFTNFLSFYQQQNANVILAHPIQDREKLKRHGIIEIDQVHRVIGFEEKPQQPRSNLIGPAFYILKKTTLPLFPKYLKEEKNVDAPGYFINWLYPQQPVFAYVMDEPYYDIGTLQAYRDVCEKMQKMTG